MRLIDSSSILGKVDICMDYKSKVKELIEYPREANYSMNAKSDFSGLTARDISVAMSMITAATEPKTHTVGFTSGDRYSDGVTPVNISARKSLQENISLVSNLPFGGTDCALQRLQRQPAVQSEFVLYGDDQYLFVNV